MLSYFYFYYYLCVVIESIMSKDNIKPQQKKYLKDESNRSNRES